MLQSITSSTISLLICLLLSTGCEKKEEPSQSSTTKPAATASRIGPAGGTVERGRARLVIPDGALSSEQEVDLVESPDSPKSSYSPAGPAFVLKTGQANFAKPVTLVLPIDAARLPHGTKPEQVYAVLSQGGLGERLDGAKTDLSLNTVTVTLDRSVAMVHADGAAPAGPTVAQAAASGDEIVVTTPTAVYHAPKDLDKAQEMIDAAKAAMRMARQRYQDVQAPKPEKVDVYLKPLHPHIGGMAHGTHCFDINSDTFLKRAVNDQADIVVHEYFHLIQNLFVDANMKKPGIKVPQDQWTRGECGWLYEGTATWMSTHLLPFAGEINVARCSNSFGFKPLNAFEEAETSDNPHQYEAFIFFSWIDTLYVGRNIVLDCWRQYLSGSFTIHGLNYDAPQGRGCFNPLDVLDHILKNTPDNQGRKRGLADVYAEFLVHYYWLKDFGPLVSGSRKAQLGGARELHLPTDATYVPLEWKIPFDDGGARMAKNSLTVTGGPFAIVRMINITSACDASKNEKGDLVVGLSSSRKNVAESRIIVFPQRGQTEDPFIGDLAHPVKIPQWETCTGAIVWIVDTSPNIGQDLTATAELKPSTNSTTVEIPLELADHNKSHYVPGERALYEYWVDFTLRIRHPPDFDDLMKTAEGQVKMSLLNASQYEALKKAIGDGQKWALLKVSAGKFTEYVYAPVLAGKMATFDIADWHQPVRLPRDLGPLKLTITLSIFGQTLTETRDFTVAVGKETRNARERLPKLTARIPKLRQRLTELQQAGAPPAMIETVKIQLSQDLIEIATTHLYLHEDAQFNVAIKEAIEVGIDADKKRAHSLLSELALEEGRLEDHIDECGQAQTTPNLRDLSTLWLLLRNDAGRARETFRTSEFYKNSKLNEWQVNDTGILAPLPGEEVLR